VQPVRVPVDLRGGREPGPARREATPWVRTQPALHPRRKNACFQQCRWSTPTAHPAADRTWSSLYMLASGTTSSPALHRRVGRCRCRVTCQSRWGTAGRPGLRGRPCWRSPGFARLGRGGVCHKGPTWILSSHERSLPSHLPGRPVLLLAGRVIPISRSKRYGCTKRRTCPLRRTSSDVTRTPRAWRTSGRRSVRNLASVASGLRSTLMCSTRT